MQLPAGDAAERHVGEVARDPEGGGAPSAVLERDEDHRVGAGAPVARALVGADQEDRRPRLRRRPLVRQHVGARERARLTRPEPSREDMLPRIDEVVGLRGRVELPNGEEEAAGGQHVAGLLFREDRLEHVVAPHGQVARGDVRGGGQRHKRHEREVEVESPAAPPGVDDGVEPEHEQREVDREHRGDQPPVEPCEGARGREREQAGQRSRGDGEQHEAAPSRAVVQLPRPRNQHREQAGNNPPLRRLAHRFSVRAVPGVLRTDRKSSLRAVSRNLPRT